MYTLMDPAVVSGYASYASGPEAVSGRELPVGSRGGSYRLGPEAVSGSYQS
jgi:hypothetical protein